MHVFDLSDGGSFPYTTKVVKAQSYGSDEIFDKRLLLLLPYYLMRYESTLDQIATDDTRTAKLVEECVDLHAKLTQTVLHSGDRLLYEQLIELIIRVVNHIMRKQDSLRGKVRSAMGGEVLELVNDRAARLEREAEKRGFAQGERQGVESMAQLLKEQGLDDARIDQVVATVLGQQDLPEEDAQQDG